MVHAPNHKAPRKLPITLAYRYGVLVGLVGILILLTLMAPRFDQPTDYNHWVDERSFLGIPHFGDVTSNLGFLWVGLFGLWALINGRCRCDLTGEKLAWTLVFTGVFLTAFGSAYYHWDPDNARLLWDRLPMALGFMALLSALLIERLNPRIGLTLLPILLTLGCASVIYWYWTTRQGAGDLRPYLLVQAGSLLLIPLILVLFPPVYDRGKDYLIALSLYALAILTEHLDAVIFEVTGWVSGHNLKHLIAALAAYWLLRMLLRRRPAKGNIPPF